MIVTRKRRKRFPWKPFALPLLIVAFVAFALSWPPLRNAIASGPAAPLFRVSGSALSGPLHFAAQDRVISDRDKQIAALQAQITGMQSAAQAKDKKLTDLQSQIPVLAAQAASARGAGASAKAKDGAQSSSASFASDGIAAPARNGSDLSGSATPDMHRTAQIWANMEPENAAKVVTRLPVVYVAHVFAVMPSDAAGAIMDALPAAYAAQLTQEHPELAR
ncbi:MAG: hypothetical protein M3R51_03550 [Candidatus Eremiobacteraeota bacterium]|nr:hypothetical protein [Candidatus Eremiobacteraeota bacterium]